MSYFDNFNENCPKRELKPIEGIYSGRFIEMNPVYGESFYEVAIFYIPSQDQYNDYIMRTNNPFVKSTQIGDIKIVFEESALGGDFDVRWFHSPKRNKKGEIKKNKDYYWFNAEAISDPNGHTIKFIGGNFNVYSNASGGLIKKYPK